MQHVAKNVMTTLNININFEYIVQDVFTNSLQTGLVK